MRLIEIGRISLKPAQKVDLQMPAPSAELALLPSNETAGVAPATAQARTDYHLPLPDSARSQSHLCTFLSKPLEHLDAVVGGGVVE